VGGASLTRLDVALAGIPALGLDTAPFIYFVERHPRYLPLLRDVFRRIDAGTLLGYGSVITLTEVLTRPFQAGDVALVTAYRDLLLTSRHFSLVPIDAGVAERAAELRARYRLRTPDALQLSAALNRGCPAFLTNDHGLRRVGDLQVLVLDDLEL
jgi:predicted nucleic acid-binding protein